MVTEASPSNPKTLHPEALDLAESLEWLNRDLQSLRGEPTAGPFEMGVGPGTSLTQIILHCKWLVREAALQVGQIRQEIEPVACPVVVGPSVDH